MKTIVLTLFIGIIFGTIDILPMIKMKLDKFAVLSAFVFYLIVPFIVFNKNLLPMAWWLNGGVITFIMALPIIILNAKEGPKTVVPIAGMSVVLGTLIGIAGNLLNL